MNEDRRVALLVILAAVAAISVMLAQGPLPGSQDVEVLDERLEQPAPTGPTAGG